MAIFWIFVQQVCYCCIKYAYENILGRKIKVRAYVIFHGLILLALFFMAFETDAGINLAFHFIPKKIQHFYPHLRWNFFFAVMFAYDLLLLTYAWRIYRLFVAEKPKPATVQTVLLQDALIVLFAFGVYFLYHWGLVMSFYRFRLPIWRIRGIQLFFTGVLDFFFPLIEAACGLMLWRVYKTAKKDRLGA